MSKRNKLFLRVGERVITSNK